MSPARLQIFAVPPRCVMPPAWYAMTFPVNSIYISLGGRQDTASPTIAVTKSRGCRDRSEVHLHNFQPTAA